MAMQGPASKEFADKVDALMNEAAEKARGLRPKKRRQKPMLKIVGSVGELTLAELTKAGRQRVARMARDLADEVDDMNG
jgi:hypothetical protein